MSLRRSLPDRKRTLSPQEKHIAELLSQMLKNREIALELGIGVAVVRNYISSIYDKVGMSNRVELALWYEARKNRGDTF
jgi:DNA-binding NarL/FixJ family response regulator